ncbi:MAG TPA: hypothetical protein DDZ89_03800, partial [Clostridiales bacterium]|nr:hypothetical protein [Clostridiales bacterium]
MSLHKFSTRFISIVLVALLLLSSACSPADQVYTDITEESIPALTTLDNNTDSNTFKLSSDYVISYPNKSARDEVAAANLISRGLNAVTGLNFNISTDRVTSENEGKSAFEILIGPTNRTQSQDRYNSLLHLDYSYEIISKNVAVICGGSPEATLNAARAFMKDLFGYEEDKTLTAVTASGKQADLSTGTAFLFKDEYPVKTLKIGGIPIDEYSIVSAFGQDKANLIVSTVAKLCGTNIPVLKKSEYIPDSPAIYIGCSDAEGNHLNQVFDNYVYYITAKDSKVPHIIIDTAKQFTCNEAVEKFVSLYFADIKPGEELDIPINTDLICGYALGSEGNKLQLSKIVDEKTIAQGITYEQRLYKDQNNLPVRAYVLTITKGSGRLYTGTPDDGELLLNKNGTVLEEMNAAVENGRKAVAGVNADFFAINGDYLPRGLCIKEGKVLHGNTDRPWFGVLHDGSYIIGSAAEYKKVSEELQTALGGHHIILKDSKIYDIGFGNEFG